MLSITGSVLTSAGLENDNQVSIRRARKRDLRRIAAIEEAVYVIEGPWSYEDFVEDFNSEERYYLVAVTGEEIIGYSACYVEDGCGQLTMNTVLPAWRGKGLATLMLEKRLHWLDLRVEKVELQTRLENSVIQKTYQKHGFASSKVLYDYYGEGLHAQEMLRITPQL